MLVRILDIHGRDAYSGYPIKGVVGEFEEVFCDCFLHDKWQMGQFTSNGTVMHFLWVQVEPVQQCEVCNGTGAWTYRNRTKSPCKTCNGKGFL